MNGAGIHSAALIKVQLILSLFIFFTYSPQTIAATTRDQRSLYSAQFHVAPNEAKLVVSIVSYFRNIVQYCSGTLLTDTVVLTAAHCLYREDAGLADNVRVTNEGWTSYARELVLRRDFVQLPAHKSICADMALVILPNRVTGFTGPFGIKFAQLSPAQLLAEGQAAEIFALGYGITEFNRISLLPRKVPMQLVKGDAECTLNFLFSHSAISCSGDSGGPVLYYPKNGTKAKGTATISHNKTPVYLGLSSQIAIYEDDWELNNNLLHPAPPTVGAAGGVATVNKQLHQDVEDCKRASELVLLQTYYIQNWLIMLIRNEKQQMRKQLYQEALYSLIGQSQ